MFNRKEKSKDSRGGRANIYVRFQGQEGVEIPKYAPGQQMMGVVNIEVPKVMSVRGVDIELQWETQGKGDRDGETVDRDRVQVSEITPGNPLQHPFAFNAPMLPWTYEGELIRIVWSLRVQIDVDAALDLFNMMDISHDEPFILRP
jgi:hypothetical protein